MMQSQELTDEGLSVNSTDMTHLVCECQLFAGGRAICGMRIKNEIEEDPKNYCVVCVDLHKDKCKYCGG